VIIVGMLREDRRPCSGPRSQLRDASEIRHGSGRPLPGIGPTAPTPQMSGMRRCPGGAAQRAARWSGGAELPASGHRRRSRRPSFDV